MIGILDHVWGHSKAQDRVWAQVSGLAPTTAGERLFIVLQAFIDESFDRDGVFVLGGCIATAESWAGFSKEWVGLLPKFGVLNKQGRYSFKMSEMALLEERMNRVSAFYRVIEKHVLALISCKIDSSELERAKSRFFFPGIVIEWDKFHSYMVAYRYLMDKFHISRMQITEAIPIDEKIDFYFDERSEKKAVISSWDDYIEGRPDDIRQLYGATPRFEDDNDFLPLQAADFWVWWVRKWYAEGTPEKIMTRDFGAFQRKLGRKVLTIDIVINEGDLIKNMVEMVRKRLPLAQPIVILDSPSEEQPS